MFDFFKRKINLNQVLICIGQEYHDDRYSLPYVDGLIKYLEKLFGENKTPECKAYLLRLKRTI